MAGGKLVSTALSEMRVLLRDKNTSSAPFTDAEGTIFLNIAYLWWSENMERKTTRYDTAGCLGFVVGVQSPLDLSQWAALASVDDITFTKDVAEVLEIGLDGSLVDGGIANETIPLERIGWAEMRQRHVALPTNAQPTHWSAVKLIDSYNWRLSLYPPANYADTTPSNVPWKILAVTRQQPTAVGTTTNHFDVGDSEANTVVLIASILAAPRIGRPALAEHFRSLLPQIVQDKMATTRAHDEVNA